MIPENSIGITKAGKNGEFSGYGAIFNIADSDGDNISAGAFAKTLKNWQNLKRLPPMLWQHRRDEPIGVFKTIREDNIGLYVEGKLLIEKDQTADRIWEHIQAGSISGLSIGGRVIEPLYDKKKDKLIMNEIMLHEISVVSVPAHPQARIDAIRKKLLEHSCVDNGVVKSLELEDLTLELMQVINMADAETQQIRQDIEEIKRKFDFLKG